MKKKEPNTTPNLYIIIAFYGALIVLSSVMVCALYAYFSDSKNTVLSFWCDACSISVICASHGKSQLAKCFHFSYTFERYGGSNEEGWEIS